MPHESFESALERLLAERRHNRRRFVGRAGSAHGRGAGGHFAGISARK